jgi:hypothetical protein
MSKKIKTNSDKKSIPSNVPKVEMVLEKHLDENGNYHNDDGPALVTKVSTSYYKHGILHRENDLPALILCTGETYYYFNGLPHRDNGKPAVITPFQLEYWKHGKLHRDDGLPAVLICSGQEEYWENGDLIKIEQKNAGSLRLNNYKNM